MSKGKRVTGVVLMVLAVLLVFFWESRGKEKFLYDEIPVLKKNVEQGQRIEKNMIGYINMNCSEKCIAKENIATYEGKEASQFIHKGVPLFEEYFSEPGVVPDFDEDRMLVTISQQMVVNYWGKIRKGDRIAVYRDGKKIAIAKVETSYPEERRIDVVSSEKGVINISKAVSEGGKLIIVRG